MSTRNTPPTRTPCRSTRDVRTGPPRRPRLPQALATGLLAVSAVVGMSSCSADATEPDRAQPPSPTTSVSTSPHSTDPSPTATGTIDPHSEIDLGQRLPATDLDLTSTATYTGAPRLIDDVHHRSCLEEFGGDAPIPKLEGEGPSDAEVTIWSAAQTTPIPPGWKLCNSSPYASFAVPEDFTVVPELKRGGWVSMIVLDGNDRHVAGVKDVGAGSPSRGTRLLRVVDVQRAAPTAALAGETAYLRTLVVQARSGPQLLVDLVSAPYGKDPESLDVWDLATSDVGHKTLVYAAVPLSSPQDADRVIGTRMHQVLEQMVGSYRPAVGGPRGG